MRNLTALTSLFLFVSCSLLGNCVCTAAVSEDLWQEALDNYTHRNYRQSVSQLQKIIAFGRSPHESAARLLLGRIYMKSGNPGEADGEARGLIRRFPQGRYAAYAHYLLAQLAFLRKSWFECAWESLKAAETTQDDDLNLLAREKLERVYEFYLSDAQRDEIMQGVSSPDIQAELSAARQGYRLPVKAGVVLSLSGSQSAAGQEVLAGIQQAYRDTDPKTRPAVELLPLDSRGNVIEAVRAAESLISDERVLAIVGDLDGTCSAAIAAVASQKGVPLIVPAAPDVGLTQIGDGVFQMMANYRLEAESAAAFARQKLGVGRAAVLAPASEAGSQRAKAFQDKFEMLGGEVASVQWYYSEATNFRRQLEMLMRLAAEKLGEMYMLAPEEIDELANWMNREEEKEGKINREGEEEEGEPNEILDSLGSPINYFDAIYIPVQADELSLLAPQIAAMDFQGRLIGDAACLDEAALATNRGYVEGMILPSNFSSPLQASTDPSFVDSYSKKTGQAPTRWNILGYDACGFLLSALEGREKLSPKRVSRRLHEMHTYEGERMEMFFPDDSNVNHGLFILRFENGTFYQEMSPKDVARDYFK